MDDRELADRLRAGDERAFRELVASYGGRLARLARSSTRNPAVIEEAVQETWLAVIRGIHGFEGRSSLGTWVFGILVNQARRVAVRESRHVVAPASDAEPTGDDPDERVPGLGPNGHWVDPPTPWDFHDPQAVFSARETIEVLEVALAALPEMQRLAVLLRDVEGLPGDEVCNILGIRDTHQRVLLHRGRTRLRRALDEHLRGDPAPGGPRGERT